MDHANHWKQVLSRNHDIQGGALMTTDGVLISSAGFGSPDDNEPMLAHCAAAMTIAQELSQGTGCGDLNAFILEGKQGYTVLLPVLDKAILAVLVGKQAKLGLVLLDMQGAIDDGSFGPGLATDLILPPRPLKGDAAHAIPE